MDDVQYSVPSRQSIGAGPHRLRPLRAGERGVSMVEYAIALSILVGVFILIRNFLGDRNQGVVRERADKSMSVVDKMPPCGTGGRLNGGSGSEECL